MGNKLAPRVIHISQYIPTSPRTGVEGDAVFRMSNVIIKGRAPYQYASAFIGNLDLSQNLAHTALTGTVALNTTTTVTGTGTAFTTECHLGQYLLAVDTSNHKSYLLAVQSIASTTSLTVARAPLSTSSVSGLTVYRLPIIFPVNDQIGGALRGNVVKLDNGTLLGVGAGVFTLNGAAISSSWTLTSSPQIALLSGSTYSEYTLGMTTPTAPTLASVAGGTVGMQAANYSIVIARSRVATGGYNNPSPRADVTLAAGNKIRITFPATDTTDGQDAWNVYGTLYASSLGADLNYLNGPWYFVQQIPVASLSAGTYDVEWLDAQIENNDLITFNNNAPPKAEFVALFNGVPVWISCEGAGGVNPGPLLVPAKPNNVEAAPLDLSYPTSPPETILGAVTAQGRMFLLTSNHLEVALGTPSDSVPIIVQPFWSAGFRNPYQVVFVNGLLYGFPTLGPARSVGTGDEASEEYSWAAPVSEFTDTWVPCHVLVGYDPATGAIVYIHSAEQLNASGFWTSRILMWGLDAQSWVGDITLSSTTGDQVVSGVATVGNYLYLTVGGRQSDDSVVTGTFQFNGGSGSSVSGYLAPQYSDYGVSLRDHVVKAVKVTGELASADIKVYGAGATQTVDVAALEAGTSALATQSITTSTSAVAVSARYQLNCPNLELSTVRVAFTYPGSGTNRIDELVVEAAQQGVRR